MEMDEIECYLGRLLDPESSGFATDLHGFTKGSTRIKNWGNYPSCASCCSPKKNPWSSVYT